MPKPPAKPLIVNGIHIRDIEAACCGGAAWRASQKSEKSFMGRTDFVRRGLRAARNQGASRSAPT